MFTFREAETALLGRPEAGKRPYSSSWTRSRRWAIPPLADRFRVKARIPVAVGLTALRVLLTPLIHPVLSRRATSPLKIRIINHLDGPCPAQMLCLLTPVSLINGHRQAGDLRYIVPGECHIVLVEHLQSAHTIILRKACLLYPSRCV